MMLYLMRLLSVALPLMVKLEIWSVTRVVLLRPLVLLKKKRKTNSLFYAL